MIESNAISLANSFDRWRMELRLSRGSVRVMFHKEAVSSYLFQEIYSHRFGFVNIYIFIFTSRINLRVLPINRDFIRRADEKYRFEMNRIASSRIVRAKLLGEKLLNRLS